MEFEFQNNDSIVQESSWAYPINNQEQEALIILRERLSKCEDLSHPTDDVNLLIFLRYTKYDLNKCIKYIKKFWIDKERHPALYKDVFPSLHKESYRKPIEEKSVVIPLAKRDKYGRKIILFKPGNWNPKECSFMESFRASIPIIATIVMTQDAQLNGMIYIIDLENFTLQHIRTFGPMVLRDLMYCTNGYPAKVVGIHFVNNPYSFNTLWSIAKYFLKPKIKERFHFHGWNLSQLHHYVEPSLLPAHLGGELSLEEVEEPGFTNLVLEKDNYFRDFLGGRYGLKVC